MRGADPSTAWGKPRSGEETVEGIIAIDIAIVTKRGDSRSCQKNLLKSLGKDRETGIAVGPSVRRGKTQMEKRITVFLPPDTCREINNFGTASLEPKSRYFSGAIAGWVWRNNS